MKMLTNHFKREVRICKVFLYIALGFLNNPFGSIFPSLTHIAMNFNTDILKPEYKFFHIFNDLKYVYIFTARLRAYILKADFILLHKLHYAVSRTQHIGMILTCMYLGRFHLIQHHINYIINTFLCSELDRISKVAFILFTKFQKA